MNVDLFNRVNERILAEHTHVWMAPVWRKITKLFKKHYPQYENLDCGAAGCYCGHTIIAAKPSLLKKDLSNFEVAAKLLDIPTHEAEKLFIFHNTWDVEPCEGAPYADLGKRLDATKPGTLAYAKIVVQAAKRCMKRNKKAHYDGYMNGESYKTVAERAA